MIEGQRYRDECGISAQKHLKLDAGPNNFPKPSDEVTMAAAILLQVHKVVLVLKDKNKDWYLSSGITRLFKSNKGI